LGKCAAFPLIPEAGKTASASLKSPKKGKSKQEGVVTVKYNISSDGAGDARELVLVSKLRGKRQRKEAKTTSLRKLRK
jgi:hypothetical protein